MNDMNKYERRMKKTHTQTDTEKEKTQSEPQLVSSSVAHAVTFKIKERK